MSEIILKELREIYRIYGNNTFRNNTFNNHFLRCFRYSQLEYDEYTPRYHSILTASAFQNIGFMLNKSQYTCNYAYGSQILKYYGFAPSVYLPIALQPVARRLVYESSPVWKTIICPTIEDEILSSKKSDLPFLQTNKYYYIATNIATIDFCASHSLCYGKMNPWEHKELLSAVKKCREVI